MLIKNGTTNIGTDALYVMVGPMLHAATITQLKIMSMTTVLTKKLETSIRVKIALVQGSNTVTT
jgi:hypothetical protein